MRSFPPVLKGKIGRVVNSSFHQMLTYIGFKKIINHEANLKICGIYNFLSIDISGKVYKGLYLVIV